MTHPAPYPPFSLPQRQLTLAVSQTVPASGAVGYLVFSGEEPPAATGIDAARAAALGFSGKPGDSLVLPGAQGPVVALVGAGKRADADAASLRDAASLVARAVPGHNEIALVLPQTSLSDEDLASAVLEGTALARYVHRIGAERPDAILTSLTLVADAERATALSAGLQRGEVLVGATKLTRDLCGLPGGMLTATKFGEVATEIGTAAGLEVEVFDEQALVELGCGGLLGVNLGSVEPPVMIKLVYRPAGEATGRLSLVGKGIMYDAGGLALKPGDEVHATMKNDMTGAAAIFGAMTALGELGCTSQVTGFLMCTDNMPSGSALRLGDIISMRDGTTVEVINTDAEGRLVMADALVLATEEPVDAIVDIATLTGACLRTFGTDIAGVLGNDGPLLDQVKESAERVDEPVWELPLAHRYRGELDSEIADLRNLGGPNAGTITAALFLNEFVGEVPWAHIDIAGTAQANAATKWRNKGTTGFGTRLLIDLALHFRVPAAS
ncbi:leucyl aminopeptidase [Propioniciclava coleopterorum]|uniref:Probable cytosol aminopeptidase n=1 Tax=Propioniciclava coleopterorum TaxID=2714937 RepID=A0A6G7Y6G3_9ACTN|nr:leucyl aminopeptidase [Propioniciclava coleopterorum]QIK72211.1 leucyl aminopeptidase [Propioniciclava coleopterorum]